MSAATRARRERAPPFLDPPGYARHRPEATLFYQLVERHYPAFREMRTEAGRPLPDYIEHEFDAYLKRGRLEEGFLRVRCETCHAEKLVAISCKKRGFCPSRGARRCWPMRCCQSVRCGNGCCRLFMHCDFCWPGTLRLTTAARRRQ